MPKRFRTSFIIAASLLLLAGGFQNCAKDLPSEVTNPSVVSGPTRAGFRTKVHIGSAKQNADISSTDTYWKDVPGVALLFNLSEKMTVEMRGNGSATTVAGTAYSSVHCGIRFVVDGVPYGHATWGDVIVGVSACSASAACHTPWSASRLVELEPGEHNVRVQMTGWPGADSTCVISSQDYAAVRLVVDGF